MKIDNNSEMAQGEAFSRGGFNNGNVYEEEDDDDNDENRDENGDDDGDEDEEWSRLRLISTKDFYIELCFIWEANNFKEVKFKNNINHDIFILNLKIDHVKFGILVYS